MDSLHRLILDGLYDLRVAVPDVVDSDSSRKIDDLSTFHINHHGPAGFFGEGLTSIERILRYMLITQRR
jgi:hypothetical protein